MMKTWIRQFSFKTNITVKYVNLGGFAKTLIQKTKVIHHRPNTRLFFKRKQKNEYTALYINVNVSGKLVELGKEDPEYRPVIIHF
jgi:hypothetical protein